MPPQLALLGCITFVLTLLVLEHKQRNGTTVFLWVPTVWFLLVFSRPVGVWLQVGGATIEEGSPLDQLVLVALATAAIAIIMRRRFPPFLALQQHKWLTAVLVLTLLSTTWSDTLFVSMKRWLRECAIPICLCLVVLSEPRPRVSAEVLLRRVICICIPFSYILIHYFPHYGKIYVHVQGVEMWVGVTGHKNQLAQLCMLAFLLSFYRLGSWNVERTRLRKDKFLFRMEVVLALIALALFIGPDRRIAYSATSLLATMVGCSVLLILLVYRRWSLVPGYGFLTGATLLVIYGSITPYLGKLPLFDVSKAVGRSSNLTGRGDVWASLIPAVQSQPFLGSGYGGFWTTEARRIYDISDAHNGYLGVTLETGLLGLMFYAAWLRSAARTVCASLERHCNWATFSLMLLISVILHNVGEASLTSFDSRLTAAILLTTLSCGCYNSPTAAAGLGRPAAGGV